MVCQNCGVTLQQIVKLQAEFGGAYHRFNAVRTRQNEPSGAAGKKRRAKAEKSVNELAEDSKIVLQALQIILQEMLAALVQEMQCPECIVDVAGSLWFALLQCWIDQGWGETQEMPAIVRIPGLNSVDRFRKMRKEEQQREMEFLDGQEEQKEFVEVDEEDEQFLMEENSGGAFDEKSQPLRYEDPGSVDLALLVCICYLSSNHLRLPFSIVDFVRWCQNSKLPFLNAFALLPDDLQNSCVARGIYINYLLFPPLVPSLSSFIEKTKSLCKALQQELPEFPVYQCSNPPLVAYRTALEVGFSQEVSYLCSRVALIFLNSSESFYRRPFLLGDLAESPLHSGRPWFEVDLLMTCSVILTAKMLYGFDGKKYCPSSFMTNLPGIQEWKASSPALSDLAYVDHIKQWKELDSFQASEHELDRMMKYILPWASSNLQYEEATKMNQSPLSRIMQLVKSFLQTKHLSDQQNVSELKKEQQLVKIITAPQVCATGVLACDEDEVVESAPWENVQIPSSQDVVGYCDPDFQELIEKCLCLLGPIGHSQFLQSLERIFLRLVQSPESKLQFRMPAMEFPWEGYFVGEFKSDTSL